MTKNNTYEQFIPANIIDDLTEQQVQELNEAYLEITNDENKLTSLFDYLKTTNPAIWYLLLQTTWKYNLADNKNINDTQLKELFDYDRTHLDEAHKLLYQQMSSEEKLFEQSFNTACSFLKSENITPDTVHHMLNMLQTTAPSSYKNAQEFCEVLAYQLLDKWDPKRFTQTTKQSLVDFFQKHEAATEMKRFNRFIRKSK